MDIGPPRREEAAAIAVVHVQGWREAYGHLLPERFYDDAVLEQRRAMWTRALEREEVRDRTRVARADGVVIGFALRGPADREDPAPARATMLFAIYVLASHHGTGAGQGLLDAVLGAEPAQLWVARDNPRAIAFYTRNGFTPDGAEKADPDLEDLPEIRLVR